MKIIGFSGKKQSGKTTAVYYLSSRCCCGHDITNFASYLKEIVCRCFGDIDENGNNIYRRNIYGSDDEKNGLLPCGKSGREVLQIIGTDWFRSLDSDCWVKAYKNEVISSFRSEIPPDIILTGDVRFPNEVKCIQELGGHVIRLLRAPFPEDKHESETALDRTEYETQFRDGLIKRKGYSKKYAEKQTRPVDIKTPIYFDAIIDNREMTIEQQNEAVWKLVNEKGWI